MTDPREITARLIAIAEPACVASGYDLVDVHYESGNAGWVVRFYIDHLPGHVGGLAGSISFADCERLSRELSALLDVEDPVPHGYSLEVSSPGVDRPLRTAEHFRRAVGQTVKVELAQGIAGRRNFKGLLVAVEPSDGGELVVLEIDGERHSLPHQDVVHARLVPDWNTLLKSPGKQHPQGRPKAPRARAQD